MDMTIPSRGHLIDLVNKLPLEVLPELANFLGYLQFKAESPTQSVQPKQLSSGSDFLLSIADIGSAEEDLSEKEEDILADEIDPIRGWSFERGE